MKKIDNLAQLYAIALGNWNVCPNEENTKIKNELERELLEAPNINPLLDLNLGGD